MTRSGITLLLAVLLLSAPPARTAPLDKEGCAKLRTEEAQLVQAGTRTSMSKGPEWAKTNLAPDKLEQIRRLLEVDEQLQFRCHGKALVNLPRDPDADPAAREVEGKEPAAKRPKAARKKAAVAKKGTGDAKAEPQAETEAATPKVDAPPKQAKDAAAKPVVAKAAKKSKAKQKADDAYRAPTAAEPGADPFPKQ